MMRHTKQRGFTLLIAAIFTSVMLAFAVSLGSLGYKQSVLSSAALQSNAAFYTADAALECVLYADQQNQTFAYSTYALTSVAPVFSCEGTNQTTTVVSYTPGGGSNKLIVSARVSLDAGTRCADVTIYKQGDGTSNYLYSVGYNVSCATVASPGNIRFVARGLQAHY